MKKLAILAAILALAVAAPVAAQNNRWDKTVYPGNCTKLFHVVNTSFAGYTDLVGKFGGDAVKKFVTKADLDTLEGSITTGEVACMLFYPGTYSFDDAWTVSKPVVIMSASGNPDDVDLNGDTSNVDVLIFADGSDGSVVKNVRFTLDNATSTEEDAITIQSGADGITIDNVTFVGSSTASTDASGVTVEADRTRILNSLFIDVATASGAVDINTGDYTLVRNCTFIGTKASQVAIDAGSGNLEGYGLGTMLDGNRIAFTAASSDVGIQTASSALNNIYSKNEIYAADPISSGSLNTTLHLFENVTSNATSAAWITN